MRYSTEKNMMLYLTGKQTEADVTVEELEAITQQYPYFGAARLLLAKKAQAINNPGGEVFAQNAMVHFANPYWFHFKLNEEQLMQEGADLLDEIKPGGTVTEKTTLTADEAYKAVGREEYLQLEKDVARELANNEGLEESILTEAGVSNPEADEIVPAVSQEDVPLDKDDIVPAVLPEDVPLDKDDIVPAVEVTSDDTTEADDIVPAVEQEEESAAEIDETLAVAEDEHPETASLHIPGTGDDDYHTPAEDEDAETLEDEEPVAGYNPVSDKISSVLQEQLQEFKKPVAANTPVPIETEPYHTVDYFASQGIKLSLDQQRQDNLGVKVRKFTDWLKQMKRVNPAPADLGIDEAAEHKVQTIAATSNEVKEVVTEAMAEVLAMQGMNAKAIQVYKKLSFLEPTKSAYFAAKIDNLKG